MTIGVMSMFVTIALAGVSSEGRGVTCPLDAFTEGRSLTTTDYHRDYHRGGRERI